MRAIANEYAIFCFAVQFLTRIPIPRSIEFTTERQIAAVRYYPAVGLLIGAIAALIWWLAHLYLPPLLAVLLSTAVTLTLTGAFHEDGLADTFDGVGGAVSRDRALEIMKDSRIGTYGAAALVIILMTKVVTLSELPADVVVIVLISAHALSRVSSVMVIATSAYARDEGTGKPTADGISSMGLSVVILTTALILACVVTLLWTTVLFGCIAGIVVGHVASRLIYERKIEGYTGDCLGATQQISEVACYLGVLACV